jgi:hypothetical protein
MFRDIWLIVPLLGGLAGPMPSAAAQQQATLAELGRRLNINLEKISVSGVSSGGSIAHQFHVAHPTNLIGVGIVAGGPYHCAQGAIITGMQTCTLFNAHANCSWMVWPFRTWCQWYYYNGPGEAPAGRPVSDAAMEMAQRSVEDTFQANLDIDDPHGIVGDRVIILHGTLDELLPVGVSDALDQYYAKLYERLSGMQPAEGTLRYLKRLPVNHSMPTDNMIGLKVATDVRDLNIQVGQCMAFGSPYINACRADDCAGSCCPTSASGDCGDPANAQKARCRTCGRPPVNRFMAAEMDGHISSRMQATTNGRTRTTLSCCYPQVAQRQLSDSVSLQHSNPFGCWDQWGYTGPNYHTRGGRQIKAVWRMIQALAPELGQQASSKQ